MKGHPVLKNLLQFRRDQIGTLTRAYQECGPISQLTLAYERLVFVNDPALIRRVLVDDAAIYSRTESMESPWLKMFLGDGLLTTDGELWRRLRRASKPAFSKAAVGRVRDRIESAASSVLDDWEQTVAHGRPLDLFLELIALTTTVAYRAFFGLDLPRADALAVARGLLAGQEFVVRRIKIPLTLLARIPTPWNLEFQRGVREINRVIDHAIRQRLAQGNHARDTLVQEVEEADDMLGVLLASSAAQDPRELREQVVTNFTAAPENTATALTWSLYLLSQHPHILRDLRAEDGRGGEDSLLRRVLLETLRLYPGAPYFDRRAIEDGELGGHTVPRGSVVMISPYVLHRTARYWGRPNEFDPARFEDSTLQSAPAYIPFGLGARRCIGDRFGMTLLETVLPLLLRRFDVEPISSVLEIAPMINLRPKGGFPVRVRRRMAVAAPSLGGSFVNRRSVDSRRAAGPSVAETTVDDREAQLAGE